MVNRSGEAPGAGGRTLAINCYSYIWRFSVYETLLYLSGMGYRQVELMVNWPHLWPSALGRAARRKVEKVLSERNLEILSLAPPMLDLNLVSPAPEMRQYTIDHYVDVIRLAGEWGVPRVVVVPGKTHPLLPAPSSFRDRWFGDALEVLDREAKTEGTRISIENVPSSFLPRAEDLMAALEAQGNDRLGLTYDVANAVFAGEDPAHGLETVKSRLDLIHISDTGLESWAHSRVGTGVVPFDSITRALDRIRYSGPSSLEVISDQPDRDILASHEALARLGWETAPRPRA